MFTSSWFRPASKQHRPTTRLAVERLEDRDCPSGGYLLVNSFKTDSVLRYDAATGAFVDEFIPHRSGGLNGPWGVVIGPHDHNVYVTIGHFKGPHQIKAVLRYDGATGAFLDEFVQTGQMNEPHAVIFGPDGNLYFGDRVAPDRGRIARFDGTTGAYLDDFVPVGSGGLAHPLTQVFGPNGRGGLDLYVSNGGSYVSNGGGGILRYDGTTGAFIGTFVPGGSGGLTTPLGMVFGPDGNLYVAEPAYFVGTPAVLRFQGPTGPTPGAFLDAFVPAGRGGLLQPFGVLFGPDRNGDGRQDLYVTSDDPKEPGFTTANPHNGSVKVYDGVTGAYLSDFVTVGSGGLREATMMTFTETDPVTLAYRGDDALTAASLPAEPVSQTLTVGQSLPLLREALARWQTTTVDTSELGNIQIQIADLSGTTLALASGHTIYLDDNAAGWGWFVDSTPWDDSEFTTPGDQGEENRMDLLSVLMHEVGHLLGHDHDEGGVMAETLSAGERLTLHGVDVQESWWLAGLPVDAKKRDAFGWWL